MIKDINSQIRRDVFELKEHFIKDLMKSRISNSINFSTLK